MKYIKKPIVIDAIKYTGDNYQELKAFVGDSLLLNIEGTPGIKTLEGEMTVSLGDYVIKGIKGEFYPCKPDIFEGSYESVEDPYVKKRKVLKG